MLSYYDGWKPQIQSVTGALAIGSRVHNALEVYYKGDGPLLEQYDLLVNEDRFMAASMDMDLSTFEQEAELGRLMLEGYLQWVAEEGIDSIYEVIGVEEVLSVPMLGGRVHLIGKIDLRVRDLRDGAHLVLDHKTAASLHDFTKWSHMNPQLMTYQTLDYVNRKGTEYEDERLAGGIFRILKKVKRGVRAKPPFYDQKEVRHNVFTLRSFWTRTQGTLLDMVRVHDALDQGADHREVAYPTPSRDCSWWCPFYSVCPLMDDGSDYRSMLDDLYVKGDPYDYYKDSSGDD